MKELLIKALKTRLSNLKKDHKEVKAHIETLKLSINDSTRYMGYSLEARCVAREEELINNIKLVSAFTEKGET